MGTGILVCGLNGSGKSTLGRALAQRLGFRFIDSEDLFFPKTDPNYLYASPRTREETEELLWNEIQTHESFVLAAVKGDYGERVYPFYKYVILIDVPKEIRLRRVRERSFQKFGERMRQGGDLFETEERFYKKVESRPDNFVEEWLQELKCPVLRVDGTKDIQENVELILSAMQARSRL